MFKNLRFVVHVSLRGSGPQGHLVDHPFKNKRSEECLKNQIKVCFTGTQSDLGRGRGCHMHLCTGFMWLATEVCCHHHICLHGGERPCQPSLWLFTSSRSEHHLQCHHWYWEGEGRDQTNKTHARYKRPLCVCNIYTVDMSTVDVSKLLG